MIRPKLRTVGLKMEDLDDFEAVRSQHNRPKKKKKKDQSLMNPDEPSTSYLTASSRRGQCASTSSGANPQLTMETQAAINIPPSEPQSGSPTETGTEESGSATPPTQFDVNSSASSNPGNAPGSNAATGSNSATISSLVSEGTQNDSESGNRNRLPGGAGAVFEFENSNPDVSDGELDLDYDPDSSNEASMPDQQNVPVDDNENIQRAEAMEINEDSQPGQPEAPPQQQ